MQPAALPGPGWRWRCRAVPTEHAEENDERGTARLQRTGTMLAGGRSTTECRGRRRRDRVDEDATARTTTTRSGPAITGAVDELTSGPPTATNNRQKRREHRRKTGGQRSEGCGRVGDAAVLIGVGGLRGDEAVQAGDEQTPTSPPWWRRPQESAADFPLSRRDDPGDDTPGRRADEVAGEDPFAEGPVVPPILGAPAPTRTARLLPRQGPPRHATASAAPITRYAAGTESKCKQPRSNRPPNCRTATTVSSTRWSTPGNRDRNQAHKPPQQQERNGAEQGCKEERIIGRPRAQALDSRKASNPAPTNAESPTWCSSVLPV